MIKSVANAISIYWANSGIIKPEDTDSYIFGLELFLSTTINLFILFAISYCFGSPLLPIPYLATFIPLRLSAGGYHSKRHLSCISLNTFFYSISIIVSKVIVSLFDTLFVVVSCTSSICVFIFSPVQAKNKPLTSSEKIRNRHISLILSLALSFSNITIYYSSMQMSVMLKMMFCGQAVAAGLMLLEKALNNITNRKSRKELL